MSNLPAPVDDDKPREGQWIPSGGFASGTLDDPHSGERAAQDLRGDPANVSVASVTQEWVLQRLVREATDFGTRSRQTARVASLKLIGDHLAMFAGQIEQQDPVREALKNLDPWERKARILELASRLVSDPEFAAKVAKATK